MSDSIPAYSPPWRCVQLLREAVQPIHLESSLLALPSRYGQPEMHSWLRAHIEALPQPEPDDYLASARRAIATALSQGREGQEQVARDLGVSVRSLQRRLRSAGQTYRALADEVRLDLAAQYLLETELSVAEIAFLLGFSEPGAFGRAFKRQVGESPGVYRKREARAQGGASGRTTVPTEDT